MQVITLLGKMLESYSSFDIQQNEDCTIYTCYSGNYIVNEIESIVDVAGRGEYSVIIKANEDCYFEIVAIRYEDDDGNEIVCDVRKSIQNEMRSRELLDEYYQLCEEAVNQV